MVAHKLYLLGHMRRNVRNNSYLLAILLPVFVVIIGNNSDSNGHRQPYREFLKIAALLESNAKSASTG